MKKISKIVSLFIFVLVVSVVIASCQKAPTILFEDDIAVFKMTNNPSVHMSGSIVYEFDETRHQVVYTESNRMYMVTNMEQTEFYSLTTTSTPRLNATVNVKVRSVGIDSMKPAVYTMVVIKIEDGKIWFWDSKSSVGFVIDIL